MLREFSKGTQRFAVRSPLDPAGANETRIQFSDRSEIQNFFGNAMGDTITGAAIQRIAQDVAPTFCRRNLHSPPQLSEPERLDYLFSEIGKGNVRVVLKNGSSGPNAQPSGKQDADSAERDFLERTDILKFVERQVNHLKKVFFRIVHADYHILETVYNYDENSTGYVPVVIDPSSVMEHSTGWTSWDNPFELAALGAFKSVASYQISTFLKLSNSIKAAAVIGAQTELVSAQYSVTGKSVISKNWYGSYAIRYNLRTLSLEIPWIKFKGCGQEERMLVELKRKDRLMFAQKPVYNHPEVMIPPFIPMEKFLSDYQKGFSLPEHDIQKAIIIS